MSLRIRMARGGAKKRPFYRIVVADSRKPRDGRFIERIGSYNPMLPKDHPERVKIDEERAKHWLGVGALPSDRVHRFLGEMGLMEKRGIPEQTKKHLPGTKAQERAAEREEKAKAAAEEAKEEAPAEEAAAESAAEEASSEEAAAEPAAGETPAEEPAEEAPAEQAAEEAPKEEAPSEEAPAEETAEGAPADEAAAEEAPADEEKGAEEEKSEDDEKEKKE